MGTAMITDRRITRAMHPSSATTTMVNLLCRRTEKLTPSVLFVRWILAAP